MSATPSSRALRPPGRESIATSRTPGRLGFRAWTLDVALACVAFVAGAPSLFYPLGRDQGLYFYVGREWLQRGRFPYLDSFDVKTPGIYAVHALAIALFGEVAWGARLLELACVVAVGFLAATLAAPFE